MIHFLFMLRASLPHASIWRKFFEQAPAGTWAAWAHCTDRATCQGDASLSAFPLRLVMQVPSQWELDLVSPVVGMLRSALEEDRAAHPAPGLEKFVIVSDSTLPVKPFAAVYQALAASNKSDFCFNEPLSWARARINSKIFTVPKHWEWLVLNRVDAERLVQEWIPPVRVHDWQVPLPNGAVVPRDRFQGGATATDEDAIYALTHGAVELDVLNLWTKPAQMFLNRRCWTYVIFPGDVHFMTNPASSDPRVATTASLFADKMLKTVSEGIYRHPVLFQQLSSSSWKVLQRSPYLFARKFAADAPPADFASFMFQTQPS